MRLKTRGNNRFHDFGLWFVQGHVILANWLERTYWLGHSQVFFLREKTALRFRNHNHLCEIVTFSQRSPLCTDIAAKCHVLGPNTMFYGLGISISLLWSLPHLTGSGKSRWRLINQIHLRMSLIQDIEWKCRMPNLYISSVYKPS